MPVAAKTRPINLMFRPRTPGVFLRLLREAHDLSQAALGKKIDVSAKRVSDFENGQRGISKEIAKQLAQIFNVSPARFI